MTEQEKLRSKELEDLLIVLEAANNGHIPIEVLACDDPRGADPVIKISTWVITVFNDAGSWDYIDKAVAPSGNKYTYEDLNKWDAHYNSDRVLWGLTNFSPDSYDHWGLDEYFI